MRTTVAVAALLLAAGCSGSEPEPPDIATPTTPVDAFCEAVARAERAAIQPDVEAERAYLAEAVGLSDAAIRSADERDGSTIEIAVKDIEQYLTSGERRGGDIAPRVSGAAEAVCN